MKTLEKLIQKREELKKQEKEINKEMTLERNRLKQQKEKPKHIAKGVDYDEYLRVVKENTRIRGLMCLLVKTDSKTYEKVGKLIGVSGSRAGEIIKREMRLLRLIDSEIQQENTETQHHDK